MEGVKAGVMMAFKGMEGRGGPRVDQQKVEELSHQSIRLSEARSPKQLVAVKIDNKLSKKHHVGMKSIDYTTVTKPSHKHQSSFVLSKTLEPAV
jgi:hypothetical protein